ncbi:hypothetical protein CASFOL_006407 [Castilleja foliolosa]|uniref:DNL-type domain-containing protein n=1 Tax=Castilleja foliolosa TaxID=1961234 RepID=A0ABD3EA74_9LAMI
MATAGRTFSLIAAKTPQNLLPQNLLPGGLKSTVRATIQPVEKQVKPVFETNQDPSIMQQVKSNLIPSVKQDHAVIFSCKPCNARSVKIVCRDSYDKGVVVARCDGCNDLHLIVDRLGVVGEHASIADFLAAHGQDVEKKSVNALNLMLDGPAPVAKEDENAPATKEDEKVE